MHCDHVVSRLFGFGPEALTVMAGVLALIWTGVQPVVAREGTAQEDTAQEDTERFVGLQRVESSSFDELYAKPEVDFSRYDTVTVGNAPVSFNPNWLREHRKTLTDRDVQRIEETMARLLGEQLIKAFTEEGAYKYAEAEEAGEGTLLLSPSISRLHLNAPDTSAPGIRKSLVTSAGHATLSLDVYDAATGELLMRVQDHRFARGFGSNDVLFRATRASNAFEMRQMMSIWADRVHDRIVDMGGRAG